MDGKTVFGKSWVVVLLLFWIGAALPASLAWQGQADDAAGPWAVTAAPITMQANDQLVPRAAYGSAIGEYLVAWEHEYSASDHDIYARRVDGAGTPLGGEIAVTVSTAFQLNPDLAYNPAYNEYLVVWEEEYSATDHDIRAWRVSANGERVGGEIVVADTGVIESHPAVAYNPSRGEFLVVWEHLSGSEEVAHFDIYAQRLHPEGLHIGNPIVIANSELQEQHPAVADDGSDYLVVWQGWQPYAEDYGIYAQRVTGLGALAGSLIPVSTWEGDQVAPRLAYNPTHAQYLVVWQDHHYTPAYGSEIYGQRVSASGDLVDGQFPIASGGDKNRFSPDVAYSAASRSYLVAWDFANEAWDRDVYARRVAYDGTRPEDAFPISNIYNSHEMRPALAAGEGNALLAVWEDYRNYDAQGVDIYGEVHTVQVPRLEGYVYSGMTGDERLPLAGVSVELYCSNDQGAPGVLIADAVTARTGWYGLPGYTLCEFYHIVESDPAGYVSVGSSTLGGVVASSNWIYYTYPLQGKVLTGNKFWDIPEQPEDTLPPGNWANFSPTVWVNTQSPETSVQVEDTVSGLDVGTAEFSYSTDAGTTWSAWQPAACTGSYGTTAPQVISASPPFGRDSAAPDQNQVRFRIRDLAGNVGESPAYAVRIDTVPPQNPSTWDCPTHPESIWKSLDRVSCNWAGATDAGSGVAGYNVDWSISPTAVPPAVLEITSEQAESGPLNDGGDWYFHVRAIDQAGNAASGARHYGPIRIDTTAPYAWMTGPGPGAVNVAQVTVSWAGFDAHAGIQNYDLQISNDGVTWVNWRLGATLTSGPYTGTRGQTVYFRARARDNTNNLGAWSSPWEITFGVEVTVIVENESGVTLPEATVYLNGDYRGQTYGNGTIQLYNVLLGDQLSARYTVASQPAKKGYHDWVHGPGNWAYRIHLTSISFDNAGNPQQHTVTNTGATQVLRVRRDNALIGFYLLVSVEWDADTAFLTDLLASLRHASDYLFDITDGQMYFEVIDIWDEKARWDQADARIHASNSLWAHAHVGGIWEGTDEHMSLSRFESYGTPFDFNVWDIPDAYRTVIHEFGHYGLDLYDEYENTSGGSEGAGCTVDKDPDPSNAVEDQQASLMDFQGITTEMCSSLTVHPHNTNTMQHEKRGGPCWDTVVDRYKDAQNPPRWILERPNDRGSIMPGPDAIPVPDWTATGIIGLESEACAPFATSWIREDGGAALDYDTWVEGASKLYQGKTRSDQPEGVPPTAGVITILGAHHGDAVRVSKSCGWFCSSSGTTTALCPSASGAEQQEATAPEQQAITLERDPFGLEVSTLPQGDGTTLIVEVQASIPLPQAPQVEVWQGAGAVLTPTLAFDGVKYTGQVSLDPQLGSQGQVFARAVDAQSRAVHALDFFSAEPVEPDQLTWVKSADGLMEIFLPAGSLEGEPVVSIQPANRPVWEQGGMMVVGRPYEISSSDGTIGLNQPAVANIYFASDVVETDGSPRLDLYHWDEQSGRWVPLSGTLELTHNFVSAEITELGAYAILRSFEDRQYLPLVVRQYRGP